MGDAAKVVALAAASAEGKALEKALGKDAVKEIIEGIVTHSLAAQLKTGKDADLAKFAVEFLKIEQKNAMAIAQHIQKLGSDFTAGKLKGLIEANKMEPAAYGATDGDTAYVKAAKWIGFASTTTKSNPTENAAVAKILEEAEKKTDIQNYEHLVALNKVLAPRPTSTYRGVVPESPLPSSPGGAALLKLALGIAAKKKPAKADDWRDLACFLFGAVIRCHGFIDANGRTGRAAYALAHLKGKIPFVAMTVAGEKLLTGLK
jgi:hypothetical protein